MDSAQIILITVITLLAVLLVILGVQVFFILREFRKTLSRANKVLDNIGIITQSVSAPISSLSGIAAGIKTGTALIGFFKKILLNDKEGWKKMGKRLFKAISISDKDSKSAGLDKIMEREEKVLPTRKVSFKEKFAEERPKVRRFFRGISRHVN